MARATGKNRGWETKPVASNPSEAKQTSPKVGNGPIDQPLAASNPVSSASTSSSNFLTPRREDKAINVEFFTAAPQPASSPFAPMGELSSMLSPQPPVQQTFTPSDSVLNGLSTSSFSSNMEVPAISLFRRDKVSELLQRCELSRHIFKLDTARIPFKSFCRTVGLVLSSKINQTQ